MECIHKQNCDGSTHSHILNTERFTVSSDSQKYVLNAAAQVVLACSQAEYCHYLTCRSDVESAFLKCSVGLASESCNNETQITVVDVEYPLPQHLLKRKTFFTMLIDIVVKQGADHVVGRSYGMKITGEMEIYFLHWQYLGISSTSSATLHSEAWSE